MSNLFIPVFVYKIFLAFASVVTILVTSNYLTQHEVGVFYTTYSILMAHVIFELGVGNFIIQVSAHNRTNRFFDEKIVEDVSSYKFSPVVCNLISFSIRYYAKIFFLLILFLYPVGVGILSNFSDPLNFAYILALIFMSMSVFHNSFLFLFEGLGAVNQVYRFKFFQELIAHLFMWISLLSDFNEYSLAVFFLAKSLSVIFWNLTKWRRKIIYKSLQLFDFNKSFLHDNDFNKYRKNLSLSWLFGYLSFHAIVPLVFYTGSSALSGTVAIMLNIRNGIISLANAFHGQDNSRYGYLIAQKHFKDLIALFNKNLINGLFALFFLICTLLFLKWFLENLAVEFNVFDWGAYIVFILSSIFLYMAQSYAVLIRASLSEVFVYNSIVGGLIALVVSLFYSFTQNEYFFSIGILLNSFFLGYLFSRFKYKKFIQEASLC